MLKENLNVALIHLEAAMSALGLLAETLDELEQSAEVRTAKDVVNDAAYGLQAVERSIGDIGSTVDDLEEE